MEQHSEEDKGTIQVTVRDGGAGGRQAPIKGAEVLVSTVNPKPDAKKQHGAEPALIGQKETDQNGRAEFELPPGKYSLAVNTFVPVGNKPVELKNCDCACVDFDVPVGFNVEFVSCQGEAAQTACPDLNLSGTYIRGVAVLNEIDKGKYKLRKPVNFQFISTGGSFVQTSKRTALLDTTDLTGEVILTGIVREVGSSSMTLSQRTNIAARPAQPISGEVSVKLGRTATAKTSDMPLWTVIRAAAERISFNNYKDFIDGVMCTNPPGTPKTNGLDCSTRSLPFPGVDAYSLVKCATEVFLMTECGVVLEDFIFDENPSPPATTNLATTLADEQARFGREITAQELSELWSTGTSPYLVNVNGYKTLPYLELIRSKLGDVPLKGTSAAVANCYGILQEKLINPCLIELIWSYWHEEGQLVQTMKAINLRFQNKRGRAEVDPLMRFDIDPLRPLGNLLWGYIQDEQHRLTVVRRAYEYDHHYGITLQGRAVPVLRTVDGRSKFLEAFHNLLYLCSVFFKEDDDTTVIADGFPVMNAIREVHLLLAEGAHNQFGDLPSTARQEMLIEQWLLARPEMREFLGGRIMVPYSETWMDRVDTVKRIQGWTDTTISDFHYLAVFGEQILLSIRYGHWSDVYDPTQAANWARYWRAEIQSYVHSYRAVTGVDLTLETGGLRQASERYAPPSVHLRRRLDYQLASNR